MGNDDKLVKKVGRGGAFGAITSTTRYGRLLSVAKGSSRSTFSPAPVVSRNSDLEKMWVDLLTGPNIAYSDSNNWRDPPRVRPSSFPFCEREDALKAFGYAPPDDFTVRSNFFTEVGKALHYVHQNGLARSNRLWGRWKCARPSCGRVRKPISVHPGNRPCTRCQNTTWEYEELKVEDDEIGLRGHVDGVFLFDDYQTVLEVKTADHDKVVEMKKFRSVEISQAFACEAPWYGYGHQARTYVSLLRKKYPTVLTNLKFVDYFIQSRNDPDTFAAFRMEAAGDEWWDEIRRRIVSTREKIEQRILPVGFAQQESDIKQLPACTFCRCADVCFNPPKDLDIVKDELYTVVGRKRP